MWWLSDYFVDASIRQTPNEPDMEPDREKSKATPDSVAFSIPQSSESLDETDISTLSRYLKSFERMLVRNNVEARGVQRVLPSQRHTTDRLGFIQMFMMWYTINLTSNITTLGILGPTVYGLPFLDSCLCSVFGMIVGSLAPAYIATFGPRSGNRTMIFARYTMGWWPSKILVLLTLVILIGYALVNVVIAGQILNAVSANYGLSIIVGIVITSVIVLAVTVFGYSVFHYYGRYAWLPQLLVTMILAGVAGPDFNLYADPSPTDGALTRIGNRLSYFGVSLATTLTYSGGAADYFTYYPENSSRIKIFIVTLTALVLSAAPLFVIGSGLGSGVASNQSWAAALNRSQGALIIAGLQPLGGFGKFCGVVLSLGLISNTISATYSSGIDFQALGPYFERVPRVIWNIFAVIVYTVCAIAGRQQLANIFTNFLALMGYWVSIWLAIVLEEHLIFRKYRGLGWDWECWNDAKRLPVGIAALVAFLVGWAGAVLCMDQVYFVGPISALIGKDGGDVSMLSPLMCRLGTDDAKLGNYVGFAWAAIVYPGLRVLELRRYGR